MRRALRHLFTILSALSLLIFVVAITFWARSYFAGESVRRWTVHTDPHAQPLQNISLQYGVAWGRGNVQVWSQYDFCDGPFPSQSGWDYYRHATIGDMYADSSKNVRTNVRLAGFQWWHFVSGVTGASAKAFTSRRKLVVPLVYFFPAGILPLLWFRHHRRRRRREAGNLCPTCGYDLRAHNAGDRCPECGMVSAGSA